MGSDLRAGNETLERRKATMLIEALLPGSKPRMKWCLLALTLLARSLPAAASGDAVEIRAGTKVVFASAAEGARLLTTRDVFVRAMSPFDRAARLKTDKDVTEAEYLAFVARQTRDWNEAEKSKLRPALEAFRARTNGLDLRFPPAVTFVKTTGLEEGRAAYCRGSAVVLPAEYLDKAPAELEFTVFHELFHIYRRFYDGNRRELYKLIGFVVCPEIVLPDELRARKITNPDAPLIDSFIRVRVGGVRVAAAPVLIARTERYDTKKGGEFFDSMDFRLLVLDQVQGRFQPALLPGGKPRLLDPAQVPDYLDQIGRNTQYIIHPEEILADNFVFLVNGKTPLASPAIVDQMRSQLKK